MPIYWRPRCNLIRTIQPKSPGEVCREALSRRRESFVFETVFSDPVGDKLNFLKTTADTRREYTVGMMYIGLASVRQSMERVAMRVSQGRHDVPSEKLQKRFRRTLANLKSAIRVLLHVLTFDHCDLAVPFRRIAEFENGVTIENAPVPRGFRQFLG